MAYRYDSDLEFLRSMTSEDLGVLVEILTGKQDDKNLTEELTMHDKYKRFYPDHIKYVEEIMGELQCFGANTFATMFRGGKGVLYKEILCDMCDKMKVNYNKESSVEHIEDELFSKILRDSMEKMSEEELKKFAKEAGFDTTKGFSKQAILTSMIVAIRAGGFMSYQIAVIVANAVAKVVLGRGLTLAANAGLTRAMSVFAGPIGWAITGAWTAVNIAGPAFRITMPAVIEVAFLRKKFNNAVDIFLTGESGVGKDTIYHILKDGKFGKWDNTTKLFKDKFDSLGRMLRIVNTAGHRENDSENIEARRNLPSGTRYVYVFNAYDYFTNAEIKKQVNLDIETHKDLCEKNEWNLKIIGTHKDICLKRSINKSNIDTPKHKIDALKQWIFKIIGIHKDIEHCISDDEIQKLVSEFGGESKCQILDLTIYNDSQMQENLYNFIVGKE